MIYVTVRVKLKPSLVPALEARATWRERGRGLIDMLPFLTLMICILGGIYTGLTTPTEAAAFSVFLAVIFSLLYREFTFKRLLQACINAAKSSALVFFIIIGAQIFTTLISKSGVSRGLVEWFASVDPTPLVFFLILCLIYFVLGCLMDGTSIVYLTIPVLFPLITGIGFDPIWFGVVLVVLTEVAMLTPPVGMNLFVLLGITGKSASFKDVVMGNLPYVFIYFLLVALLYIFPDLATWLPSTMK